MKSILYFQPSLCASNNAELNGVFRYARSSGWQVHVVPYGAAGDNRQHGAGARAKPDVRTLRALWRADGAIVDCGAAPKVLSPADFVRFPTVFLDYPGAQDVPKVETDSTAIAETAARELLRLPCAACAFVPWRDPLKWSVERGVAFERIVRMNGREIFAFDADTDVYDDERLCAWLAAAPKPLGVFAANDYVASQVLSCAELMGIGVPDDISIIGVDNDLQICEHAVPPLTSIQLDHERGGYLAAELLSARIANPRRKVSSRVFGPIAVIHRESLCRFRRNDTRVGVAVGLIRKRACQGLTVAEVAAAVDCSPRLLEMRFREVLGHSVRDEILSVRTETAKLLLQEGSFSVAEIASRCGYGSTEALRKVFVSAEGVSPKRWRKGDRKNR